MAQKVYQQYGDGLDSAYRNRLFFGTSEAAGIAIIVPATTGGHPTLWNMAGSGVVVAVRELAVGYVSGNNAPTNLIWAGTESTGAAVGTGAPIATFTTSTAGATKKSAYFGSGFTGSSLVQWSGKTNTFTAAPAFLRPTGISLFTGVAATAVAPFTLQMKYDDLFLAPGTAISLCTTAATTTSLLTVVVAWEEIPISDLTPTAST